MKFSDVIDALQKGGIATRHATPAFSGKWIVKQIPQTVPADVVPKMTSLPDIIKPMIGTIGLEDEAKGSISYHDQVIIVTLRDDERVSATYYIPTWEDIFAEDWMVQTPAEDADFRFIDQPHGKATPGKRARDEKEYLRPYWDAEHNGVFVPVINKIIQLKDLSKDVAWEKAKKLAEEAGGELMSRKDADLIHFFLEDINRILTEHGGDPIESYHWTSQEYGAASAWGVSFGSGYVYSSYKFYGYAARAVVAL